MISLFSRSHRSAIPGFGLTMGFTLAYLSLLVLIPLSGVFFKGFGDGFDHFWNAVVNPRAFASYRITLGASLFAAGINTVFGLLVAWVLVRYRFPGKKLIDALVDLPFALPTAVAGIALTALYAPNGWIGWFVSFEGPLGFVFKPDGIFSFLFGPGAPLEYLVGPLGLKLAYSQLGIIIALTFIGLPFVVRTLQPVLQDLHHDIEEAAASLGATRQQIFCRVILPELYPALLTGFALAFARALGEYGSVIFIAGNMPYQTEITPLLIVIKLEQYDYSGAAAIATVMLVASFIMLLAINGIQWWSSRYQERN